MNIDIRTLSFVTSLANVLQFLAIAFQYVLNKKLPGALWWLLGFASISLGCGLSLLREVSLHASTIIVTSNTFFVLGIILLYVGVLRFLDRQENRVLIVAIFIMYLFPFSYFTFVLNDIATRIVIVSLALAIPSFLMTHALFFHKTANIRASANFNALICFMYGSFFTFRAVAIGTVYSVSDYFAPTFMQTATFVVSFVTGILLTFGLIIMVNQWLGKESQEAKEHLELIFNTSPDSVLITRLSDGYYMNINEGFTSLTGYTRAEALGKSSLELNLWDNPADRQRFTAILTEKGSCDNMEITFRRKDGTRVTGLMSAKVLFLDGAAHVISVVRDISDRKLEEQKRERLVHELQKAFRQIKNLTGLLPICAHCKKIKNDNGDWEQIEVYIRDRSEADFSHGICPECAKKLYPNFSIEE